MSATWPVRNRLRLVASASVLAGAAILLLVTEWGALTEAPGPAIVSVSTSSAQALQPAPAPAPAPATPGLTGGPTPIRAFGAPQIPPPQPEGSRSTLANNLNAPAGSATDDVAIIAELLVNYLEVFRKLPIGTNGEITAALAGDNTRALAPLPADHPAIDARGELIDRWGTAFFFHQLSRELMQVRSAGPDRRHFTEDDIIWPAPDPALAHATR